MVKTASAAIVGASSLMGKELASTLNASDRVLWELKLLDAAGGAEGDAGARITSAGDEALLVQPFTADALAGSDVVFLADDAGLKEDDWSAVIRSGAAVVDMTGWLAGRPGVDTRSPGHGGARSGALRVVVSAHPAAVMLVTLQSALHKRWPGAKLVAQVMVPASEYGAAGLQALQQQTISLLNFQPIAEDVFGEQTAFNLYASHAGPDAVAKRVRRDFKEIAGEQGEGALALQCIQAPVFYAYAASVFVEVEARADEVAGALGGDRVVVVPAEETSSNRSAPEDGRIAVSVREDAAKGVWVWVVCDHVKLAALNAIACAMELLG